jgi:succinate dehydrogenase/fumarate reductase flavoprotein subunit
VSESPVAWDEEFDVVVIGYGFAGAASAVAASDAGARTLLIEKALHPGGISVCSAGGVRVARDADAAFAYLKATNAGTAPDENLRALAAGMTTIAPVVQAYAAAAGATATVNWVPGNYPFPGVEAFGFVTVTEFPGFDPHAVYPHVRGLRGGARLFRVMQENVRRRPIDVRLNARARRLVRDGTGPVMGVIIDSSRSRAIRARGGVVLACGGFEAAEDMKAQYWQEKPVYPGAYGGNTGDGIRMAQAVGADLWHMWHYHGSYGFRHVDPKYRYGMRLHRLPDWLPGAEDSMDEGVMTFFNASRDRRMPWIVVDRRGRRYMNEYPPYLQDTGMRPMAPYDPDTQSYPRIPSWIVVDEAGRRHCTLGFPTFNDPSMFYEWSPDNSKEIADGILKRASSLPELARIMEIDEATLVATVARWNEHYARGCDEDFGRLPDTLMPIAEPPYYCGEVWPLVANTQGGPVHDPRQRVLDPFGQPIVGLYAAGELGSVFGHLYLSGGNLAECFIGGGIAGREAAARAAADR